MIRLTLPLLAWEIEINSMTCIVFAATEPKARWLAVKSFWEAGYGHRGVWPRPSARRVPELDTSPLREHSANRCYAPEYARNYP
jgi:hypothetical protein